MPLRPLQCSIADVSIATIGVLLMNAESGPAIPTSRAWACHSPLGRPRIQPPIQRMAPVDFSAATRKNTTETVRSEEQTAEIQSLMSNSYAVVFFKNKNN